MEKTIQGEKPYCFSLKNIPSFNTDDYNKCVFIGKCEKESYEFIKVL